MQILEIIAETVLQGDTSGLREALNRVEEGAHMRADEAEKQRIRDIVALCFEFDREGDPSERQNIQDTLRELAGNSPLEMPSHTLRQFDHELARSDGEYAKVDSLEHERWRRFMENYFRLRARANLETQEAVAKASNLNRSQISSLEKGRHMPQQKTIQKLARAFGVDVTDLMSF